MLGVFRMGAPESAQNSRCGRIQTQHDFPHLLSGPEKGVITKGVFSPEKSLESLESLNSLESLENGRNLLSFTQSENSLK